MNDHRKNIQLRRATLGGSVLAAIGASLCCLGPLLALMVGAAGLASASAVAKWRPALLAITFTFLALGWFLTSRRTAACSADAGCSQNAGSSWSKVGLWIATAFVLAATAFPYVSFSSGRSPAPTPAAGTESLTVSVPSMDCPSCATMIEKKLLGVRGVAQAVVIFKSKEALISYDPSQVSREKLIEAIDATGFKAAEVSKGH